MTQRVCHPAWLALWALHCGGPSAEVRPDVPPEPITVVNDNDLTYSAHLAVGLETGAPTEILPHTCRELRPPPGRTGELRIEVDDPDQHAVLDLYGRRLRETWAACNCALGSFRRCVRVPPPPPPRTTP
jgi:hypothetical protein